MEERVTEIIRRLLKTYGNRGKQLLDIFKDGEMTPKDAADYAWVESALSV